MIKEMLLYGKNKKAQATFVTGLVAVGVSAVVAIIMTQIYNSVYTAQVSGTPNTSACGQPATENVTKVCVNGSTKTVYANVPVFLAIGVLGAVAVGFFLSRQ